MWWGGKKDEGAGESGVHVGWEGAGNKGKRRKKQKPKTLLLPSLRTHVDQHVFAWRHVPTHFLAGPIVFFRLLWGPLSLFLYPCTHNNTIVPVTLSLHAPTATSPQSFDLHPKLSPRPSTLSSSASSSPPPPWPMILNPSAFEKANSNHWQRRLLLLHLFPPFSNLYITNWSLTLNFFPRFLSDIWRVPDFFLHTVII